jgi:hypothetical protein
MKSTACLKGLGIGVLALSTVVALGQPSFAKKKVRVYTTPGTTSNSSSTVVPTVPASTVPSTIPLAGPGVPSGAPDMICVPGGSAPCAQPMPIQAPIQPVAKDYFFCGTSPNGIPTTYVNTPGGNLPLIRWVSHYFLPSGYTPEVRCQEVSQRFNRYYNQGVLNYVTTGYINGEPTVCVASKIGGPCTGLLFTLKPNQNATRAIQQLFDVRAGASGPLYESESRVYIDMRQYVQASR